jgi:hypothetical protein
MSAAGGVASSLPLVVVGGRLSTRMSVTVGLLDEGYWVCVVCILSDVGVGSYVVGIFYYSGCGARIIVVPSCCSLSLMNTYSVVCRSSTSVYNLSIAATNFVCCAVYGGISSFSRQLALYLALSILLFYANKISRRSTGAGGSSGTGVAVLPSPRSLRILDMCGSFFALAAEPKIKTNFYSSSYASCCSLVSLAYNSTLVECVPFYLALNSFIKRCSYS